jgi:hypothetical protein
MADEKVKEIKTKEFWTPLNVLATFIIVVLLGCAIYLLIGKGTQPVKVIDSYDDHGCYITAGYSWCAAKTKCLKLSVENCTKNDLTSQMCAGYQESAVQNNVTTISYNYDSATSTCIITDKFADLTIWDIKCENDAAKASVELRNSNATQAQLEQAFNGCSITKR